MRRFSKQMVLATAAVVCSLWSTLALGALKSETLLPTYTKGLLAVPDMDALTTAFDATQYGKLMNDPLMQPFTADFKRQMKEKLSIGQQKLGITWDDLHDALGGEVSLAVVQPAKAKAGDPPVAAVVVMLADVTGHLDEARAALKKVDADMAARGAKRTERVVAGTTLIVYDLPKKARQRNIQQVVYLIKNDVLVACEDMRVTQEILARLGGKGTTSLAETAAYKAVMARVSKASGDLKPHARWFLEPFGYFESVQAARSGKPEKGRKLLPILRRQGFEAIQGLGGYVTMKEDRHELLHRTFVFAPGEDGKAVPARQRFKLAARALTFPNGGNFEPQDLVSGDLATYASFNLDVMNAFQTIGTLVDDYMDAPGVWDEIIDGIKNDPHGPRIDLEKNIVGQITDRVTVAASNVRPIGPKSERLVILLEAKNSAAAKVLEDTIRKAMELDKEVRKRVYKGHVIWEAIEHEAEDLPEIKIDGGNSGLLGVGEPAKNDEPKGGKNADDDTDERLLPNSAITVAHGHLIVASHLDILKKVLDKPLDHELLRNDLDYKLVVEDLDRLADSNRSFQFFSRTDEEFRVNYELLKQNRMNESETVFGQILNAMLGEGKKGQPREQRIDGRKLPPFQAVRRYLGPGGMSVTTEDDGWIITGFTLNKQAATTAAAVPPLQKGAGGSLRPRAVTAPRILTSKKN